MEYRNPEITIVIATFNSVRTLFLVLESISSQTFAKDKIEVLIIDGGSNDGTLNIAKKYNCKVINNPKIEPISAKLLGYNQAKGRYVIYLDADEAMENPNSLLIKHSIFEKDARIKAVIGSGYKDPSHASFLTSYINEFGDPFSFFIYRLSKNSKYYYFGLKQVFPILKKDSESVIFDFSKKGSNLLLELGATNNMLDLNYLKKTFPFFTPEIFAHLFQLFISKSKLIAMTKNDPVMHYSTSNIKGYLNKINWRIKNNIYHVSNMGISGFKGREQFHSTILKMKKYLFVPYAYSIIFPFVDSLWLVFTRKKISYFLHVPLTIVTATLILYYLFLKMFGYSPQMRSYDESKIVPAMR